MILTVISDRRFVLLSTSTNTHAWGKTLIELLTTVVSDIGSKINLINSNINSKFDELSAQLITDVKRASDTANDAINMVCKIIHHLLSCRVITKNSFYDVLMLRMKI